MHMLEKLKHTKDVKIVDYANPPFTANVNANVKQLKHWAILLYPKLIV